MTTTAKNKEKIRFSKAFWVANTVELFERAAYYGVFIVITKLQAFCKHKKREAA